MSVATAAALPARLRVALSVLSHAAAVQIRTRRAAALYILAGVQPLSFMLVTLLARHPGSRVEPSEVGLGAALISLWGATIWSAGAILNMERRQGTLSAVVARPVSVVTVLLGKSLGATLQSAALVAIVVSVVAAIFGDPIVPALPLAFTAALAAVLASAVALGMLLGCLFVLTRAAGRISEALMYPVYILGGLIVPLSLLPPWIRPLSWIVSLRWGGELLRAAVSGRPLAGRAWLALAVTTAAYGLLARAAYATVLDRARRDGSLDLY